MEPALWSPDARPNLALLTLVSVCLFREVFLHLDQMLTGSDIVRFQSMSKLVQFRSFAEHGRFPLWDPTILGGRSIVGDPISNILNPLSWIFWISASPALFGLYFWAYVTLGAWGMWLWMRRLNAGPAGSLVAAMAFAFSGRAAGLVFAGHPEHLAGMLCLPWLLWAVERVLQRPSPGSVVSLGGVLSLTATMGSVQYLYFHGLVGASYVAIRIRSTRRSRDWLSTVRAFAPFGWASLVFIFGAMALWLPVVRQTFTLSARTTDVSVGFDFATMLSAEPSDLLRLLWPFNGKTVPLPYASDPENGFFWETATYPGLVALTLAIFFVVAKPKGRWTLMLGGSTLIFATLALGRNAPLYRLAYVVLPGFSMFRVPGRLLFYCNFFLAAMAGLGLKELLQCTERRRWAYVGIVGGLLLVAPLGRSADRAGTQSLVAGAALAVIVLSILLVVGTLLSVSRLSIRLCAMLIVAVSMVDLGVVWAAHVFTAPRDELIPTNSLAEYLAARRSDGPFRYFDPTQSVPQQLAARYGLETVAGYHPGIYRHQLELYQALWDSRDHSDLVQLLMHSPNDIVCTPALDAMNTRFVIAYEPELDERFERVFSTPAGEFKVPRHVFERKSAMPRAFVVPRSVTEGDEASGREALCQENPRDVCVMDGNAMEGTAHFQPIVPREQLDGDVYLEFETEGSGVLVVSDSWHPDWIATDHGKPLGVHRANLGFLGVPLGAGTHSVHLWYRPWDFYVGCAVSAAFWLIAAVTGGVRRRRRSTATPVAVADSTMVSSRS